VRALTTEQEEVLASGATTWDVRVYIRDPGNTYWVEANSTSDGGAYPGFNAVQSAQWGESLDDVGQSATVTLLREQHKMSVAPFMFAAPANRGWNPSGAYAPLLAVGRRIQISVEPRGSTPAAADSVTLVFDGVIDTIDSASGEYVTLECRDLAAHIVDTFMEDEYVFAFADDAGTSVPLRIWAPDTPFEVGQYMLPTEANRSSGKFFEVTSVTTGVTGSAEPLWASAGTTVSGGVTFTAVADTDDSGYPLEDVVQAMLNTMHADIPTLHTPASPAWDLRPWKQGRAGLFGAIKAVVQQRGFDIRYKWRSATSQFELTLYEPERAKVIPDRTFSVSQVAEYNTAAISVHDVRNVIRVIYSATADAMTNNTPKRLTVEREDATSIASYRRRFMEIAEDSASQIDTQAEAEDFADAVLADLKDPKIACSVKLLDGFPFVEVGDLYRFSSNGTMWDSNQDLAVFACRHRAENGFLSTELQLRGQPSAGFDSWHRLDSRARAGRSHALRLFQSGDGISITTKAAVGGVQLTVERALGKGVPQDELFVIHTSETSGFTPSSATVSAYTQSRVATLPDLIPGRTYYSVIEPVTMNLGKQVAGSPSAEFSFEAGRASAGHAEAGVDWGRVPLNGGFETSLDPASSPDHWSVQTGTWGTSFTSGADGSNNYLRSVASGAAITMNSDLFPLDGNDAFHVTAMMRRISGGSGGGEGRILFEAFDKDQASLGSTVVATVTSADSASPWLKKGAPLVTGSTARFGRIRVQNGGTTADPITWDVDYVRVQRQNFQPSWTSEVTSVNKTLINNATFTDVKSLSFSQHLSKQSVVLMCSGSVFTNAANTSVLFRFMYDGTVYGAQYPVFLNVANEHQQFAFYTVLEGSAAPGTKTVSLQWATNYLATFTMNGDDSVTLVAF
jgi:hypothetical protein